MTRTVKENIELQMSELEMLFSMFPNKGEITLQDDNTFLNVQQYLNNASEALPHKIEYMVSVAIDELKERVNLQVTLPYDYPNAAPQLFARSDAVDRPQQLQLNKDLASYIASLESGELCIWTAVQWLQENSSPYLENSKFSSARESKEKVVKTFFNRMWIYSHHIYRQELRKKIFDCAKKLNLTGFCLTGKPGIICVEGIKENCEEFWHVIRYPNWKHISCKHVESAETEGNEDHLRRFHSFEDLQFQAHGDYGLRNDYHMDLGQFLEFLKEHQSEHIFQILFGIEGKSSDN
ncbi:PREDICTED: RWD domain-containing protein 2A [Gekko japonicus]|uniref:RWD domain-containing protein 2A n=1 Tax=Gekko japonicus TaxID=146911 RepID=A0ABM1KRQ3_GEKJA|nr:PREDICTED: RWD domain-containing protein 2A [Gekko japonicus]XP_015276389.1 PREDICTED: RWD domain-containing protein 2A [Gekko japonicus]XP_015276390.1 PREDICTED: RWD domain-containing protein 2A [Gekko japonicus]